MTRMDVPESEHGHARVFAIDLPADQVADFERDGLEAALGTERLDRDKVELFPASDIAAMGLSNYLVDGMGMDPEQVRPDAARLDALGGHILILPSSAVRGRTLTPKPPLRWIGTYSEPQSVAPMDRLRSDSAEGVLEPTETRAPSNAAMSGRVATLALLVLLLLVVVMIVIA
ncbi:hypothetical protein OG2516_16756 [Oceanicola granulosus HTCC2516]|uniref:Aspartate carbamoyltransferase catalytic subunit n=1 Tax=Oceanicola granulosus (strain ATCC BAA-861 / DSM 15982 / KCTC 12143 / HTCC2516) TaxID=314256 RepID=Q2CB81_OCEGH|nr:hypothetical protein [Oceanicola granulosus]EAR49904.1 hypothetical protein OG2516_16756 [Oceanicola granulosus HTCC2516]